MDAAFFKMFFSVLPIKNFIKPILIILAVFFAAGFSAPETQAKVVVEKSGRLGIIKGVVRDKTGEPIAEATVAIFRVGTSKLLKQVRAAADGSFLTKILPGTYAVMAIAEGFNDVTLTKVEVKSSSELYYGFKLEKAGSGNTLPEKLADRNSPKSRIRAAQMRRSIYQANEGDEPIKVTNKVDENSIADADSVEERIELPAEREEKSGRREQTVVETYFANSGKENYTGFNFATLQSLGDNAEIVFAGQTATSKSAPSKFETNVKYRPNINHQFRFKASVAKTGEVEKNETKESLGQISFQALDEWNVREGVIVVFGLDYSKFIGAGNDSSISPRIGFQYDINPKTRFRAAYTTNNEEKTWQRAIELENTQIIFSEPRAVQDFAVEDERPQMNKSSRLEFGIERVLDNNSSIEANIFFDGVTGRGIGLVNLPFDALNGESFEFVGNQQGKAQGVRVVYSRRLNGTFSTSAGYSFGNGQKLSDEAVTSPADLFEQDFFQTFFTQFNADLSTGTSVKTVFRLSPQATVFAIDPFSGRMAIYDPSLSVLVTQNLPNWGLPFRAEAVIDARNILDAQTGVDNEQGSVRLNLQKRILRGGISVRF